MARLYNVSYTVDLSDGSTKHVLRHVSLELRPGLTAIMGPTGAGKTTFLSLLAARLVGGTISGGVYGALAIDSCQLCIASMLLWKLLII